MSDETPPRVDWRGADMRGTNMAGLSLEHADLRGADLSGVNFTRSNLRYADLRGAKMIGTNFQFASLYGAKLQGVEAFQADFRNCDMRQCNLGGAYLEGAMLPPPRPEIEGGRETATAKPEQAKVDFGQSWNQRLAERRNKAGSDGSGQNEQAQARSLPDEHGQRDRDNGRKR